MSKKKILTLSDHPLSPSGVGTQTKYICEGLLNTGRYSIISLGGAISHNSYEPISVEEYPDDWKIIPINGYGSPELIRSVIRTEKPDVVWFMTDPRFWGWLWEMENEIRPLCSMIYYHVWDNYPYPYYNRNYYLSNDHVVTISKLTDDIVRTVAPEVPCTYIPHAVHPSFFKPLAKHEIQQIRESSLHPDDVNKVIFFWNNRNARRKQSGTLIWWFKEWLDKNNLHDKAMLIMHTEPKDPHGQDLEHIVKHLELENRQILLSVEKLPPDQLGKIYNMCDCTINISDAEGFGLSTFESLSCRPPIIATMTGGLQEQITNGTDWFGVGLYPASKSIIGSQDVPYIYEDRVDRSQFHSALTKIFSMSTENRRQMGLKGRDHLLKNYNYVDFQKKWVELMDKVTENSSWSNREDYNGIRFLEVA